MKKDVIIFMCFFFIFCNTLKGQKMTEVTHNNDYTSLYLLNPDRNKGFEISLSAVLMFTCGAADRKGLRWGGEVTLSKHIGDFTLSTGIDAYKANEKFGLGTSFAGVNYHDGKYGFSYYATHYYQGDAQTSGIIGLTLKDFQIRFEDDILGLPFTGFVIHDRYRTAALEIRYRHWMIGTNVYTNEVNGLTDVSDKNKSGIFHTGKQISSPVYVGYVNKNLITRIGLNGRIGGIAGQNWWHEAFFGTPNFNNGSFNNLFIQAGVDKPYTLY